MEFITTGNRIAVENFEIGYFYTITMLSGDYFQACCTGIGSDFVMFSRDEPDLLFSLTIQSAADVSSIEIYGGGSGTNDYNDLINKPQLNGVTLIGNKSLSDLGIQGTISDLDSIRSGAAAGATAVQPADLATALATKQDTISDLNTIRSGAAAGATAVQPAAMSAALATKQDTLSSAQLAAANSGIDSLKVAQIETNKNNILLNWGGAKNLTTITGGTTEVANRYIINNQPLTLTAGEYVISFKTSATTGANAVSIYNNNNQAIGTATIINGTGTVYNNISIAEESAIIFVYATVPETITEFMICTKTDWEKSPVYAPYAMSNVDLTAAIKALQAQLANQ